MAVVSSSTNKVTDPNHINVDEEQVLIEAYLRVDQHFSLSLAFSCSLQASTPSAASTSILSTFPTEILALFISHILDKETLAFLFQTHSKFCELASPFLFREMVIRKPRHRKPFACPVS
jgi:hypothetical protein